MYTLENQSLSVSVLDPLADQDRLGSRYCTGGYIYQIEDKRLGPLLSGPSYPDTPSQFDGQGIPDAFNLSPLAEAGTSALALIIGIGLCDLAQGGVLEYCRWEIEHTAQSITLHTRQAHQGFALALERRVTLTQRTVRSYTRLANTGAAPIPIRWFPHPFFPHPAGDELCRFNIPVGLPENPGYVLADNAFVVRKGWPWTGGFFQAVELGGQSNLTVLQKHPLLGLVAGSCSYAPSFMPIWGNTRTFSWEPFLERTVWAGQETNWWIDYHF